ncbi:hypothetical protein T03_10103 [Trichinella britovi]|uniref:Uncharacterized protein n=1 Tax=Trichinella britovi TaxID=45882 RepID=A0A0V1C5C9_TRIBR|nr:hypothetical protein T03_10103 [Trichinella britovi]
MNGIYSSYRFLGQIRRGGPEDPVAVESVEGWIICGPVIANPSSPVTTTLCASVDQGIDRTLRRFWEIEEIGVGSKGDHEMSVHKKSFRDSLSFDGTRYSVRLLKKSGEMNLPNNFELARRRLGAVERRLAQDPVRREQYASIFQDYLKNGWAERVNDEGKSGVEKLFEETDALQSAFEEGLEAEAQEASMIEWSGYRLDFLRSQARAHEVAGQGLADRAAPQEMKTADVRLPRLELPKFDGDVTSFHEYCDQFETSAHRQPGASVATKLAYLRGCLTGAALDTIEVSEVLIALCQEKLPGTVQFRWDELAQANNAVVADLPAFLRFLQQQTDLPGASRRSKEPTHERSKARQAGGCKHRGKTTDGKPVTASSPSTSASERSVAEQKTIVRSEEPSSAPVHANVATRSSQWTSRLQTSARLSGRISPPPWVSLGRPAHCLSSGSAESSTRSRMHSS